jgi:hypothetical protein
LPSAPTDFQLPPQGTKCRLQLGIIPGPFQSPHLCNRLRYFHPPPSVSPALSLCKVPPVNDQEPLVRAAHGELCPSNILLQVCPSAREAEHATDDAQMAQLAARAMDNERCRAKVANFGLGVQFQPGVSHASNVKEGALLCFQTGPIPSLHSPWNASIVDRLSFCRCNTV